jgi:hypothetical protein
VLDTSFVRTALHVTTSVQSAPAEIRGNLVPGPELRSPSSAVLRELALADDSLSAQQLAELLDEPVRPPVASLRAFLHANGQTVFAEVRRGGFVC